MADQLLLETGTDSLLLEDGSSLLLLEAIVGAASAGGGSGTTTPRVTMPNGIQAGDIAFMWVTGNTGAVVISAGAGNWTGWTQIGTTVYNSTTLYTALFTKVCDGSESGQSTGPDTDLSLRASAHVVVIRGYELEVGGVWTAQYASGVVVRSMTTWAATPALTADGDVLIAFGSARGSVNAEVPVLTGQGTFWRELAQKFTTNVTTVNNGGIIRARTLDDNVGNGNIYTPADVDSDKDIDRQNTWTLALKQSAPPAAAAYIGWGIKM